MGARQKKIQSTLNDSKSVANLEPSWKGNKEEAFYILWHKS